MPRRSLREHPAAFDRVAAVDLGSNSFHLTIAKVVDGGLITVARCKERVRLASGLQADGTLSEDAMQRALATLRQFASRLQGMPQASVRVVGTNTLRVAKNTGAFLERANKIFGYPIEVIAGKEEARLIYAGIAHTRSDKGRRLLIDIGGGSTEIIIGSGFKPQLLNSLQMGCVVFGQRFFSAGVINKERFKQCQTQCNLELQTIARDYSQLAWQKALGSSGTVMAIAQVLRERGIGDGEITALRLRKLRDECIRAGHAERLTLPGLSAERQAILAPGVAILLSCFEILGIKSLHAVDAALREGVLYELVGRFSDQDVRERSVFGLLHRYHADFNQAQRVRDTVLQMQQRVARSWQLESAEGRALLSWAAVLHEVGMSVSYAQYHKHGAYLLQHSDIDGFSEPEKLLLATLVRLHRRKLNLTVLDDLPKEWQGPAKKMVLLLRLAVLLHHRRADSAPRWSVGVSDRGVAVKLKVTGLKRDSLLLADLLQEQAYWREAAISLQLL